MKIERTKIREGEGETKAKVRILGNVFKGTEIKR